MIVLRIAGLIFCTAVVVYILVPAMIYAWVRMGRMAWLRADFLFKHEQDKQNKPNS